MLVDGVVVTDGVVSATVSVLLSVLLAEVDASVDCASLVLIDVAINGENVPVSVMLSEVNASVDSVSLALIELVLIDVAINGENVPVSIMLPEINASVDCVSLVLVNDVVINEGMITLSVLLSEAAADCVSVIDDSVVWATLVLGKAVVAVMSENISVEASERLSDADIGTHLFLNIPKSWLSGRRRETTFLRRRRAGKTVPITSRSQHGGTMFVFSQPK